MNQDDELTPLEQRARALLRDSVEQVDGPTRSRLARARAAALATRASRRWFDLRYLAPAGAIAGALLVTLLFVGRQDPAPGVNDTAGSALYDLELLADADAYELTQEADLEFIEWAASMGEAGQAGT